MCLSNVYVEEKKQDSLVIEEAAHVRADDQGVEIRGLLGESKELEGYGEETLEGLVRRCTNIIKTV